MCSSGCFQSYNYVSSCDVVLFLSFRSFLILGKSTNFFWPWFLHLLNRDDNTIGVDDFPQTSFSKFSDWFYWLLMGFLLKAKKRGGGWWGGRSRGGGEGTKMQPIESEYVGAKTDVAYICSFQMLFNSLKILMKCSLTLFFESWAL